jgi:hypothetical protein
MAKSLIAAAAALALAGLVPSASALAAALTLDGQPSAQARQLRPGMFAQAPAARPRSRIIVRPRTAPATGIYPSPLPYAYPGPNAVRECDSRLVQEYRPSGTVIVPRMWCWWTRQ